MMGGWCDEDIVRPRFFGSLFKMPPHGRVTAWLYVSRTSRRELWMWLRSNHGRISRHGVLLSRDWHPDLPKSWVRRQFVLLRVHHSRRSSATLPCIFAEFYLARQTPSYWCNNEWWWVFEGLCLRYGFIRPVFHTIYLRVTRHIRGLNRMSPSHYHPTTSYQT